MNNIYKALADPTRRSILKLLRKHAMTAGNIALHFPISKATLSRHFAVLKAANLIRGEKRGTTITYELNVSVVEDALIALMTALNIKPKE
jgi:DNA-binding transcriptional ArsR family regulator